MRAWRTAMFTLASVVGMGVSVLAQASRREPGLVLAVYEFAQDVSLLPELAAKQSPSGLLPVSTLALGPDGFAPFDDHFLVETQGFLRVERPGEYAFRLASDDGSLLLLDGRLLIDNDGLHWAMPIERSIELEAGEHALRLRYFENTGGESLRLEWKPPAAADFVLVPADALSHEPLQIKPEPGKKRIIPGLRRGARPGDGNPVAGAHPGFRFHAALIRPESELAVLVTDGAIRSIGEGADGESARVWAWLPLDFGRRTAGIPVRCTSEPYGDQIILFAETGNESKRLFRHSVNDTDNGCVFRFASHGPSSWEPTGKLVFEMLAVRALRNGFEIEFTKPLMEGIGWEVDSYYVEQWPLGEVPTQDRSDKAANAVAPQRDGVVYAATSASVSEDRRKVFLEIEDLKPSHVVYLRLLPPCVSEEGELPWSTEAWYTLNAIPKDRVGQVRPRPSLPPQNFLTEQEKSEGWKLLFNGKSTAGWRRFKQPAAGERRPEQGPAATLAGWSVIDGCLVRTGPGGDIVTDELFDNFELMLEWRVGPGGNSGIFYRVSEEEPNKYVWETGPEMQVLDNAEHIDGRSPLTSAGSNYALYAPPHDTTRPVGLFNEVRIVVAGNHVEHWLNGERIVVYELHGDDWKRRVAASKFKSMPRYGTCPKGHIALQDHGDKVWFRNIKVHPLPAPAAR